MKDWKAKHDDDKGGKQTTSIQHGEAVLVSCLVGKRSRSKVDTSGSSL